MTPKSMCQLVCQLLMNKSWISGSCHNIYFFTSVWVDDDSSILPKGGPETEGEGPSYTDSRNISVKMGLPTNVHLYLIKLLTHNSWTIRVHILYHFPYLVLVLPYTRRKLQDKHLSTTLSSRLFPVSRTLLPYTYRSNTPFTYPLYVPLLRFRPSKSWFRG